MSEFIHMGGYGFYVWGAYGFAAFALVLNIILPYLSERRATDDRIES